MSTFICVSPDKQRAIYFCPSIGRRRLYRSGYPVTDQKTLKVVQYKTVNAAYITCKGVNNAHGDNFIVVDKTTLEPIPVKKDPNVKAALGAGKKIKNVNPKGL